ncbi:hypothetical protein EMIHUDRAFT_225159 [Emiliania huxleyi CCMP1516]|uniref:Protein ENHANCED DISEASE RESISTANCE 2 C-terminal domain-containing protein n=2 Tax=Emiliania huxleyi TaxID=2903 RepID=A0A0D3KPC8_EMIH1|nr:hypothetical protein EMIHUDRAFT_225159 [Emiliania huxleyi CCMP1516]EOD37613.1 hypothetical protein EMIHUDRAFT_225159 [Emiliania huxleyi CCMP1516]|eukprot:XP_005790042.1 hypothetical protein EMIHUDRAFT_225159 [Emiliania huxleyi CCMP1516]
MGCGHSKSYARESESAPAPTIHQRLTIAAEESVKLIDPRKSSAVPLLLSLQSEPLADAMVRRSSVTRRSAVSPPPVERSPYELDEQVTADGRHCWSAIAPNGFEIRGENYLRDRKKVPSACGSQLLAVELFRAKTFFANVAGRPGAPTSTLHERCESPLSRIVVVVVVIPTGKWVVHLAMYFGVLETLEEESPAAAALLERFAHAADDFRNDRFKLIPRLVRAPLTLRLACPSRPAITAKGGRGVPQRYFSTPEYVEVDMDISKEAIANRVLGLVRPVSKLIVADLAFVLEGQRQEELPEVVLGAARLYNLDLSEAAVPLLEEA